MKRTRALTDKGGQEKKVIRDEKARRQKIIDDGSKKEMEKWLNRNETRERGGDNELDLNIQGYFNDDDVEERSGDSDMDIEIFDDYEEERSGDSDIGIEMIDDYEDDMEDLIAEFGPDDHAEVVLGTVIANPLVSTSVSDDSDSDQEFGLGQLRLEDDDDGPGESELFAGIVEDPERAAPAEEIVIDSQFPPTSDKGCYEDDLTKPLSDPQRRHIIQIGPHQPADSDEKLKPHFWKGKKQRKWLCFSSRMKKAYCEHCWLFGTDKGVWDWRDCQLKPKQGWKQQLEDHEKTKAHKAAAKVRISFCAEKTVSIDDALKKGAEEERKKTVRDLTKITRTLLFMSTSDMPLRGHREEIGDGVCKGGNFLKIIHLMSFLDQNIKDLINRPKGATRYLSPTIQNEILMMLSHECKESLLAQIRISPYYSIMLDSTMDLAKVRSHKKLDFRRRTSDK